MVQIFCFARRPECQFNQLYIKMLRDDITNRCRIVVTDPNIKERILQHSGCIPQGTVFGVNTEFLLTASLRLVGHDSPCVLVLESCQVGHFTAQTGLRLLLYTLIFNQGRSTITSRDHDSAIARRPRSAENAQAEISNISPISYRLLTVIPESLRCYLERPWAVFKTFRAVSSCLQELKCSPSDQPIPPSRASHSAS